MESVYHEFMGVDALKLEDGLFSPSGNNIHDRMDFRRIHAFPKININFCLSNQSFQEKDSMVIFRLDQNS